MSQNNKDCEKQRSTARTKKDQYKKQQNTKYNLVYYPTFLIIAIILYPKLLSKLR